MSIKTRLGGESQLGTCNKCLSANHLRSVDHQQLPRCHQHCMCSFRTSNKVPALFYFFIQGKALLEQLSTSLSDEAHQTKQNNWLPDQIKITQDYVLCQTDHWLSGLKLLFVG